MLSLLWSFINQVLNVGSLCSKAAIFGLSPGHWAFEFSCESSTANSLGRWNNGCCMVDTILTTMLWKCHSPRVGVISSSLTITNEATINIHEQVYVRAYVFTSVR